MKRITKWGIVLILTGLVVIGIDANLPRGAFTLDLSGTWLAIASSYFLLKIKGWRR